MNYRLINDVIQLIEEFETAQKSYQTDYVDNAEGFKKWIADNYPITDKRSAEPEWEGKKEGRSAESIINTLIVHLNRYAKTYSKAAMFNSEFSTQEEFIYLINLKALGAMSKMELIKKNIQEKPAGMLVINRLIKQGWVIQTNSTKDKRSKVIAITTAGLNALDLQMEAIRKATRIVTGNLTQYEKMELIRLLNKLDNFHNPIYSKNINTEYLLDQVITEYLPSKN